MRTEVKTMQRYECQDVQAVLSGLLDGELDASTSHLAEAHLSQCAPCRNVLQQAEETDDLLRTTIGSYEVWPADLDRRIRAEIFGEVDGVQTDRRRRRLLFAAWSGWSIAAVVMLGFGLSLSQGWLNPPVNRHGPVAGSDAPPPVSEIATAPVPDPAQERPWVAPVGSELAGPSIFDEPQVPAPTLAVNDNPPNEMFAIATDPPVEAPTHNADESGPRVEPFSPQALAGIEAEAEAGQWLRLLAANLVERSRAQRPSVALEPRGDSAPATVLAVNTEPPDSNTADVLHQASILLGVLEQAGEGSFSDVRTVQQALSSDDVLERLAVARAELQSPDSIDLVNRAWSMLEWTTGSVDQEELERVKQSIAVQDLPRRLERLSDQYWN